MLRENEKKIILSKNDYFRYTHKLADMALEGSFKSSNAIQTNYYYDDECFSLHGGNETLRVRQINESLSLQWKKNKTYVNNIHCCDEFNVSLDYLPSQIIANNNIYYNIGCLVTNRKNIIAEDITISLDENIYLGAIDYEIELESVDIDVINKYAVNILNFPLDEFASSPGKYSRFIARIKTFKEMPSQYVL